MTASALTYTALLALVPLMTICFALLAAFPAFSGLQQHAKELIFSNLVPAVGQAILENLDRFTQAAGQLTGFGVVGLAVTSVMLLSTIETAFNGIWRTTEPRPLVLRFLAFWTILTLSPLLFGASLSASGTVSQVMQTLRLTTVAGHFDGVTWLLPFGIETVAFSALYLVIPNRTVQWKEGIFGGIIAALLFEASKSGFGWYLTAFPTYQTVYGAISLVPIFLVWLYIVWSIVLFGAVIAAALPEWWSEKVTETGTEGLLPSQRLCVATALLAELQTASTLGVGMKRGTLLHRVPVGGMLLDRVMEQLRQTHWIARTARDVWILSRDLSHATVYDLMKALGIGFRGHVRGVTILDRPWQATLQKSLESAEDATHAALHMPVRTLIASSESKD